MAERRARRTTHDEPTTPAWSTSPAPRLVIPYERTRHSRGRAGVLGDSGVVHCRRPWETGHPSTFLPTIPISAARTDRTSAGPVAFVLVVNGGQMTPTG